VTPVLGALPTVTVQNRASVRAADLFRRPAVDLHLPLNRKTTRNAVQPVPVIQLEPSRALVSVSGLDAYVLKPRRDPPDVAHIVMRDGRERWVIQEGHTRLGAAVLRGDETLPVRVWEFEQADTGDLVPVLRGLHRRGVQLALRDAQPGLHPDWQLGEAGLTRQITFPNLRACATFISSLMDAANEANHHPDVQNDNCDVTVTFITHATGTVTAKDYAGAEEADRLAGEALTVLSGDDLAVLLLDWDESLHPRDESGKFAEGGSRITGPVRQFGGNEGYDWHEAAAVVEHAAGLPYADTQAVSSYAGFGYSDMNAMLRGTHEPRMVNEVVRPATPEEIAAYQFAGFKSAPGDYAPDDPRNKVDDGRIVHNVFTTDAEGNKVEWSIQRRVPDQKDIRDTRDKIDTINASIRERGFVLPEAMEVKRAAYVPGLSYDELKAHEGAVMEEKGFTSTMIGNPKGRLDGYVEMGRSESIHRRTDGKAVDSTEVGTAMRITIQLPEGTKVMPVEAVRRLEYEFPNIPNPDPMPDDLKKDPWWQAHPEAWTVRDYKATPKVKTDNITDKGTRSEAEILLGSGAQFRVVSVEQGKSVPRSADGSVRSFPVADVLLEYIGGGSSEGKGAKKDLSVKVPHHLTSFDLGDLPGHEFHGNQYSEGATVVPTGKSVQLPGRYDRTKAVKGSILVTSKNGYLAATQSPNQPDYFWVNYITVGEKARGKGEGTALYIAALKEAQKRGAKGILNGYLPGRDISENAKKVWASLTRKGLTEPITATVESEGKTKSFESVVLVRSEPKATHASHYREKLAFLLGGHGSGNFGHAGRPGEVGGSGDDDGRDTAELTARERKKDAAFKEWVQKVAGERVRKEEVAARAATRDPSTYTHNTATHERVTTSLSAVAPKVSVAKAQPAITVASHVADVLQEMQTKGYEMPDSITVRVTDREHLHGLVEITRATGARDLTITVPQALPATANMDDAAVIAFGGQAVVDGHTYDRFTAQSMNDIVLHEMGHVQAGLRPKMPPGWNQKWSTKAMKEAQRSVSIYAASDTATSDQGEFLAEAFVRLYRGETLPPQAQKLYDDLNGPKVKR
jgi:4a-hydroxytetrahydrobiopterin dehydratase